MRSFRKFDPWADLAEELPEPAKAAKAAKLESPPLDFSDCKTAEPRRPALNFSDLSNFSAHPAVEVEKWGPAPGGAPAEWVDGVARLGMTPRPNAFNTAEWEAIRADAGAFLNSWGAAAARLGWPSWALFGCHTRAPRRRFDGMGLVLLLHGRRVVALTETEAVISMRGNRLQTYRLPATDPLHPAERTLIWELP